LNGPGFRTCPDPPRGFVHVERGYSYGGRIRGFDRAWKVACEKAGYPGILIHDPRRSGVRALVRSGTPETVAMRISGHETRAIFDRYNITSDQDLRDTRDRRAQFGHKEPAKVVNIAR
jgi:integrase